MLDNLQCAAKILHIDLSHDHDAKAFEQECAILQELKHPCIVQFLGMVKDPDNHRPILLMELMDESLTHYLEQATTSLPYHIQVNISHDIALALECLHGNNIIHRDLSSNNILLKGGTHTKVTDFGMSKVAEVNPHMTCSKISQCPGTPVFMPPEALRLDPCYSEKLDTFSLGVLMIQIITRKFPSPTKYQKEREDPTEPVGYVLVPVPELERRKDDIARVPSGHTLLPIALHCIKDRDRERPSASQLCHSLQHLKTAHAHTAENQQNAVSLKEEKPEITSPPVAKMYERKLSTSEVNSVMFMCDCVL